MDFAEKVAPNADYTVDDSLNVTGTNQLTANNVIY